MEILSFRKFIYLVHFALGCDYNTVLTRSPWTLNEDLFFMETCDPDKLLEEYEFKFADFTIHIHGLPMSAQTIKMVDFIAGKIGTTYPITSSEHALWGSVARVRVRMDVTEPVRQELNFTLLSKKKCKAMLRHERLSRVMRNFGLSEKGIKWIHTLLQCARISVLPNGGPVGYFKVGRGLRQGDPLSPLLFVIADDILSRTLSRMIQERTIQTMVLRNGVRPSHILFEDDIFLFCNGDKRNIRKLLNFLRDYKMSSGQRVNFEKIKCFIGGLVS
ncbi:uncharacterized protein LOC113326415 [Papaver somniferum]|uniref:uncharacterized protein LOC113326415 n=1 Tax=Papaver somniferum TaxID=3469 RepID=UPI000E6FF7A8|nr:uncharacterized protein LOC113326415 [Papaver somniferum]